MSRLPGDEPADRPHLAVPLRPARLGPAGQSAEDRRRRSLLCHDIADDPAGGVALYEAVASQDTTGLSADGWADRLEALARMNSRVAAWKSEAIAGFDDALHGVSADLGHRHPRPGDRAAAPGERRWHAGDLRSVADEIALILNLRKPHATTRIHTSCELVHNFPATLHALREGWLTERAAFTIVDQLSVLDGLDDLRAAETAVLAWARIHPLADLKQECRRETARRCPAASSRRHQRAHDERSVRMIPDGDGRAVLILDQDAIDAAAVSTSLSRAAARARRNGDPRTTGQLRADIALNRLLPRTQRQTPDPAAGTATRAGEQASAEPGANTTHEPRHRNQRTHTASNSHPHDSKPPTATEPPHHPSTEPPDDCRYDPFDGLSSGQPTDPRSEPFDAATGEPFHDPAHEPADAKDEDPFDDRGHQSPRERDHEPFHDGEHEPPHDLGDEPPHDPGQDPFDDRADEPPHDRGHEPPHDLGHEPSRDPGQDPFDDRGHRPPRERDHESPDLGHEPSRDPGQDPFDHGGHQSLDNRGYEPFDDAGGDPCGDRDYEPEDYSAAEHPDDDRADDLGEATARPDPEIPDEASIGAEALVVIHATAAEVTALINGEPATGGEADHHGPIPRSSLRKHLIKALTQALLPNLPTTPNSPHPGATTRRPRTNTTTATAPHDTRPTNTTTPHDPHPSNTRAGTTATHDPHSTNTQADTTAAQDSHPTNAHANPETDTDADIGFDTDAGAGADGAATGSVETRGTGAGTRIELRITDRPPPSDPDRYTPSAALDRYVRWRDRTCQFPGCNRPAEFTDLDHRTAFAAGGRTTAANSWCLCRHHHRLKHEGGWEIAANPDGSWTWTSPTGRSYRNNPTIYHPPPRPSGQPRASDPAEHGRPPDTA